MAAQAASEGLAGRANGPLSPLTRDHTSAQLIRLERQFAAELCHSLPSPPPPRPPLTSGCVELLLAPAPPASDLLGRRPGGEHRRLSPGDTQCHSDSEPEPSVAASECALAACADDRAQTMALRHVRSQALRHLERPWGPPGLCRPLRLRDSDSA